MKKLAKIKFWSLLFTGIFLLLLGSFLFVSKSASEASIALILIAGVVQLIIFYCILFYLYKGKIRNAINN